MPACPILRLDVVEQPAGRHQHNRLPGRILPFDQAAGERLVHRWAAARCGCRPPSARRSRRDRWRHRHSVSSVQPGSSEPMSIGLRIRPRAGIFAMIGAALPLHSPAASPASAKSVLVREIAQQRAARAGRGDAYESLVAGHGAWCPACQQRAAARQSLDRVRDRDVACIEQRSHMHANCPRGGWSAPSSPARRRRSGRPSGRRSAFRLARLLSPRSRNRAPLRMPSITSPMTRVASSRIRKARRSSMSMSASFPTGMNLHRPAPKLAQTARNAAEQRAAVRHHRDVARWE